LAQRPGVTPAGTAARPAGQDTRPEQKKLAVGKLAQARAMLTQGDLDGAESAAGEAARMNVVWSAKEDSPAKLLGEVKASRTDPKALLGASRAALARKDYARAESYAKLADRHAGLLSFPPWGDSPKQALKDIKAAQVAKAPTPGNATAAKKDTAPWNKKAAPAKADAVVQTSFNTPAKGTQPPATPAKTTAQAAKPATPPAAPQAAKPGDETDETKQVLKQAREALARKDYERAHSLVAVARQMKHKLGWYDDTPDKVEGDIRRAEGNSRRPGYPAKANAPVQTAKAATPPAATKGAANKPAVVPASATKPGVTTAVGVPKTKDEAKAQLSLGRRQLDEGKLDEAAQTAQRIKSQSHLTWGLFEDSPDRLSMDLQKARAARDKAESVRVLAEGRMLYQKGDYDGATRAAYRAQKLHGSYSIWDLGDRPTKLLADVQTAQAKARKPALPPATAVVKAETKAEPASRGGLFSRLTTTPSEPSKTTKPVEVTKTTTVVKTTPAKPVEAPVVKTAPPAESPHRLKAQQLVAEAQRLHREDKLVEARLKVVEAQQLNVRFGPDETSPEFVYQQLAIQARQKMDALTRASHDAVAQARPAVAVAKLEEAKALATSFGQDVRPIEAMLTAARGMQSATGVAQATPAAPPAVVTQASQPPAPVPVPTATPQGTKLLEDARVELRKGETANARRMAEAALTGNHNVKDEAMALLRSIDAEEFNQKQRAACRAFDAAQSAFNRREFARASAMVGAIDVKLLDADRQGRLREMSMTPEMTTLAKADKPAAPAAPAAQGPIRTVGDVSPPSDGLGGKPLPPTLGDGAGRALASDAADGGLLDKHKQMQKVLFEKLRQDSLEVQRDASEKFRAGQTDQAIEALQDYLARVQEEKLDPAQVSLLKRPIDSRISQFKLLKAQKDLAAGAVASRQAGIDKIQARYKAEEMKQKNVEKLMKDFNTLFKEGKYLEAESLAMRALELDPDSGVASTAVYMARRQRDVTGYEKIKHERERLNLAALNNAEREQGHRAIESGVDYDEERWKTARNRKATDPVKIGKPSEKEKLIERQLSTPITVSFDSTPLRSVLDELRDYHGINIVADLPAMQEAGVNLESPISIKLDKVSLKSALNLILHQVRLTHVIKDEVLMVTTEDNAKGKLSTVSYSVADLVIPVENFGDVRNGSMPAQANQAANQQSQVNGAMPFTGPWSITNGQPAGTPSGGSMLNGGGAAPAGPSGGNMNSSRRASTTTEEQLIKLITSTIQPRSWSEMGGPGTLEFFPLTLSLVINQTPDIQEQIQDLLASLRRLQDQEVSVEVRFISVSEDFFERVGVNFNMQIPTNNKRYEPLLQTGAFVPDNTQFINAFRPGRFLAGMTPAGTLTPTLDIPITQNSFFQTVPQFGNYTSSGLTMGLAFLSDIQVFLFLEAAQGDQRANVMQAPKLTLFNGQTATLNVFDQQSFVSGVQIAQVQGTGQFALVPQNNPQFNGIFLTIQAVISADRRFVRLTMAPTMTNLLPGPIYTFPVVVPIFTSIEGNQAGAPVLFTQLLQQPVQTNISIQTTVAVPDGGTVLMGGLKRLSEARSEYGPPILSKLPYINRLFKNVGYGRETDSMLIMVTPRIIVQAEEEERQTGFSSRDAGGSIGP
jgi:type II secretory pathway component GspD/PulD (secretin)